MRVLVTGGAGYIGSHTLLALLAEGHEAAVLDSYVNASRAVLGRVRALSNGAVADVEGDVRDPAALDRAFDAVRPDAVIHFAGLKAVGESEERPLDYYDVNVGGTLALLRAMDRAGCRRIVFSSSATVYGTPRYLPYDEAHPTAPENVYGRTKLMAEGVLRDWAGATRGASAALLRYFNPVGAHASGRIGEDPSGVPNNLMPYVAQVAVGRRERLRVFGGDYDTADGTGVRDYIHVEDLAAAHVAALRWTGAAVGAEAFNIGAGRGISVLEMVAAFSRASGREVPYEIAPRRAGDLPAFYADAARAGEALGWSATRGVDEMCADTWRWQSANPEGYGD